MAAVMIALRISTANLIDAKPRVGAQKLRHRHERTFHVQCLDLERRPDDLLKHSKSAK